MKIISIMTWVHDTDNLIIKDVPVASVVVETKDKLVMVDTGMYGNPQLKEELEDMGYRFSDFGLVINTHLHVDHCGGNCHFRQARIIVSRKELEYQTKLELTLINADNPLSIFAPNGGGAETIEQLARDLKSMAELYPVTDSIGHKAQLEYMEDNPVLPDGFQLLPAPGHSIDSQVIVLSGQTGDALITGDALYHRTLWQKDSLPAIHYNAALFRRNAFKLAQFKGIILPGHDRPYDSRTNHYITAVSIEI